MAGGADGQAAAAALLLHAALLHLLASQPVRTPRPVCLRTAHTVPQQCTHACIPLNRNEHETGPQYSVTVKPHPVSLWNARMMSTASWWLDTQSMQWSPRLLLADMASTAATKSAVDWHPQAAVVQFL